MTIDEFAQRLGRDEHPTRLMEALRTLQAGDLGTLKDSEALGLGWAEWPQVVDTERPELWS